jgi:PleD family two-component response regulator
MQHAAPRVLVIEHDAWRRMDLVGQLAGAGCEVRDASNGFSGLRLARDTEPDVIVLGADLPDIAATEVREQLGIQFQTRSIPVIPLLVEAGRVAHSVAVDVQDVLHAHVF